MKKIIGIVGAPGSGKDAFCEKAAKLVKPVFCFRFSDSLSEALRVFLDEFGREDQQGLVTYLRKKYGEDILAKALKKKIESVKSGWVLVNGIRAWGDYEMVKSLGGKIIYITAEPKIRWQRLSKRTEKKDDQVSFERFLELENAESEQFIPAIGAKADFKITNNGSWQKLTNQITQVIESLS